MAAGEGAPMTKLLRLRAVEATCGLKRSEIYERIKEGRFPRPVPLGGRAVAWVEKEVSEWTDARLAERDCGKAP
jgi:prophage regulatory protein